MEFPDYTKLESYRSDVVICPHCGKLLKTTYHDDCPCSDIDDVCCGDYNTWYTCRCKECKISGDGSRSNDYSLSDQRAWKFPKKL